jgi:hydrogenase expression/formation protein HypC
MCLGIPGRVVEIVPGFADQLAVVDVQGARRRVNIGMLDALPAPGDWVLIHMGFAVEVVDEAAAEQALSGLELMGRPREPAPAEGHDPAWARDLGWESDPEQAADSDLVVDSKPAAELKPLAEGEPVASSAVAAGSATGSHPGTGWDQ